MSEIHMNKAACRFLAIFGQHLARVHQYVIGARVEAIIITGNEDSDIVAELTLRPEDPDCNAVKARVPLIGYDENSECHEFGDFEKVGLYLGLPTETVRAMASTMPSEGWPDDHDDAYIGANYSVKVKSNA